MPVHSGSTSTSRPCLIASGLPPPASAGVLRRSRTPRRTSSALIGHGVYRVPGGGFRVRIECQPNQRAGEVRRGVRERRNTPAEAGGGSPLAIKQGRLVEVEPECTGIYLWAVVPLGEDACVPNGQSEASGILELPVDFVATVVVIGFALANATACDHGEIVRGARGLYVECAASVDRRVERDAPHCAHAERALRLPVHMLGRHIILKGVVVEERQHRIRL